LRQVAEGHRLLVRLPVGPALGHPHYDPPRDGTFAFELVGKELGLVHGVPPCGKCELEPTPATYASYMPPPVIIDARSWGRRIHDESGTPALDAARPPGPSPPHGP